MDGRLVKSLRSFQTSARTGILLQLCDMGVEQVGHNLFLAEIGWQSNGRGPESPRFRHRQQRFVCGHLEIF
jgi:hypothetical protein